MDFCCESLETTVIASQVSSDGYEVSNLISSNAAKKSAGFIAERFIKPPVDIEFTLPCEIQLNYIHLLTSIRSHRTVGITVSSYIVPSRNPARGWELADGLVNDNTSEVFLGKCFIQSEKENEVVFINRSFVNRAPFDTLTGTSVPSCQISNIMKMSQVEGVNRAVKVKIRIWKTEGMSLPTLRKVVINGIPNRQVKRVTIEKLLNIVNLKNNPSVSDSNLSYKIGSASSNVLSKSGFSSNPIVCKDAKSCEDVPSDFLDPITCELMSYPVVLPSGNVVDQTTLDKHVSAEAVWGRPPSDPFTGVTFTANRRPIPNLALKSRIDQFLLKHSELEKTLTTSGRTTGKRSREESVFPTKYANYFQDSTCNDASESSKKQKCENVSKTNHELELNRSLSESLMTIRKSANFCNAPSKSLSLFNSSVSCVCCQTATKNSTAFYRMPCKHEVCRACLNTAEKSASSSTSNSIHCPLCKLTCSSVDIRRTY